jgi:glycosyltransferase involved in cell wall biosynthesis
LSSSWFTPDGLLAWETIGRELPGLTYHGMVCTERIAVALQTSSIMVMPSREENAPLAAIEAQACGCWPVAPKVGGIPEVIRDGNAKHLYTPNTWEALAAAIAELWTSGQPDNHQRAEDSRWVHEQFGPQVASGTLVQAVAQIPLANQWALLRLRCGATARFVRNWMVRHTR